MILFRTYEGDKTGNGDFEKIHEFLVEAGRKDYTYTRFDWMLTNLEYLEDQYLDRIGIWEEDGRIVGATLFDFSLDVIFPIVLKGYESLYGAMLTYAEKNMVKPVNPEYLVLSNDSDEPLRRELLKRGYIATEEKDMTAFYDLSKGVPEKNLPEGYETVTFQDEEDYENYLLCCFKGFGHEEAGEVFEYDSMKEAEVKKAFHQKHVDLSLKVSVKDPEGNYVAHCGMWYDASAGFAVIEPVCTVPSERKKGFGREAVYEGLRRVKAKGAAFVVVGSGQQFYYSLGFIPYLTGTMWKPKA